MTRDSFDLAVRQLATAPSRRSLLQLLTAIVLDRTFATIAPSATVAAPKRKPRPAPCQKLNRACTKRKRCCPGTKCLRGKCRCPAAAKPCAGTCIPRAACCRATGDGCGGPICHPSNGCCPSSTKLCGQTCIALDACCTNSDCTGPCAGACVAGRCQRAARGTPCGGGTRQCNSQGVCAETCTVHDDCPQPPDDSTPAEFCRRARCVELICEEEAELDNIVLPARFQTPGDCRVLVCVAAFPDGIGNSSDESDLDVPDHPSDCVESYCSGLTPYTRNRPADTPCNENRGLCDGQGACVDR